MIRRKFLILIFNVIVVLSQFMAFKPAFAADLLTRIRNRFNPPAGPEPDDTSQNAVLPAEGRTVSVETALNSRCTSDYDDNPRDAHWGMFDKNAKLPPAQIRQIIEYAKIPRFTDAGLEISHENNLLTFMIADPAAKLARDWMMVESGMQQQAVGLICAALGAGYVFRTIGMEGKQVAAGRFATVRIKLDALKPSYSGRYWTTDSPSGIKYGKKGFPLAEPSRQGTMPLLLALKKLKTENPAGRPVSTKDLGQLLWAARGRTPHYSLSAPWGMTIPTYYVKDIITVVHLIFDSNLYRYENGAPWYPMHALEQAGNIDLAGNMRMKDLYKPYNSFIILGVNENRARALWEIGYQLLNLMLQAHSLGIAYKAILLDENQKKVFQTYGITNPVAGFFVNCK